MMGFREDGGEETVVLQATRDPGGTVALVGGFLLLAGVTATIYLPHRRIYARIDREGLLLAARTAPRDDDAKEELARLAQELLG